MEKAGYTDMGWKRTGKDAAMRTIRSCRVSALVVMAGLFCLQGTVSAESSAQATPYFGEYDIKAGFIYRFISFVSWPDAHISSGTITIGILGANPFGNAFDSVEGSVVGGREVKIRCFAEGVDYEEIKSCQILFIASLKDDDLKALLAAIADSPVLTISDSPGFIDKGGMVGFVRNRKRQIGIEINTTATSRGGLTIRSMLKRIAGRIISPPEREYNQIDVDERRILMAIRACLPVNHVNEGAIRVLHDNGC